MRKYFILSIFVIFFGLTQFSVMGQQTKVLDDTQKTEDTSAVEDVDPFARGTPDAVVFDFASSAKEERERLLKILKTEEASAPKGDVDRIKRNVMRLGSYRRDWVQEARDFLIANSVMSELYLYHYTMIKNPRLTKEILKTLIEFPTLRYPRGPLAFFSFFVVDRRDLDRSIQLLEKGVDQDPSIAVDVLTSLAGTLGEAVSLSSRLKFAQKACEKTQLPAASLETVKAWRSQVNDFWERVVAAEIDSCVRGH